jgi:type I site-specific restriction endonuclease
MNYNPLTPHNLLKTRISEDNITEVWDVIRRKYVKLTPEEEVRQRFVNFLIHEKGFPKNLMGIEKGLKINGRIKRTDIVQYDKHGKPFLIVECKAPHVKITPNVFHQAAMYNLQLKVKYIILTNGHHFFCCKLNYSKNSFDFITDIPNYDQLEK